MRRTGIMLGLLSTLAVSVGCAQTPATTKDVTLSNTDASYTTQQERRMRRNRPNWWGSRRWYGYSARPVWWGQRSHVANRFIFLNGYYYPFFIYGNYYYPDYSSPYTYTGTYYVPYYGSQPYVVRQAYIPIYSARVINYGWRDRRDDDDRDDRDDRDRRNDRDDRDGRDGRNDRD